MRILLLTHRIPFPPNKGEKIRSYNMLRFLAGRHEVHVGTLVDDVADRAAVADVARIGASVLHADIAGRSRALSALRALAAGRSVAVEHFYSPALQRQLDELMDRVDFDAVLCSSSPMAEYVFRSRHSGKLLGRSRTLMDLIDVDSFKWSQYASQRFPPMSWLYAYEARRLAAYEERISRTFRRVCVVTEQEKTLLPPGVVLERVSAVGNGVDLEYFSPRQRQADGTAPHHPTLVFTGVMDYWPNVDGVKWFVESILPRVREAVPDVRFNIVGSRPAPEVRELTRVPGVQVTGFVPDVRTWLGEADVCVVPLRIARGIQNKVLEAMAMGKPVVSTAAAFEGIDARSGEDLVVAADEHAFATSVIGLLREPARARRIGEQARARVEQRYSWDQNLSQLERLLEQAGATS
jgi:sugar transferase (PEP-CTERM/EpsH1 system associated)